jgi:hypothetical protein
MPLQVGILILFFGFVFDWAIAFGLKAILFRVFPKFTNSQLSLIAFSPLLLFILLKIGSPQIFIQLITDLIILILLFLWKRKSVKVTKK